MPKEIRLRGLERKIGKIAEMLFITRQQTMSFRVKESTSGVGKEVTEVPSLKWFLVILLCTQLHSQA